MNPSEIKLNQFTIHNIPIDRSRRETILIFHWHEHLRMNDSKWNETIVYSLQSARVQDNFTFNIFMGRLKIVGTLCSWNL